MNKSTLIEQIKTKASYLCVGLDPDINKIPKHLLSEEDPILAFNKAIIDATKDYCVAYKPNIAFYEALVPKGWKTLEQTLAYIPNTHFTIADAKRGDIGNTSKLYARAFFESMSFDSITVAPYMGEDSVTPFLDFEGKWVIVLGLTSNKGSQDFQTIEDKAGKPLYKEVLAKVASWGTTEDTMFVVGATHPEEFKEVRAVVPNHFLLIPGVGAQGGDLNLVSKYALNDEVGVLINSSRGIIYAGNGTDFAEKAKAEAQKLQLGMQDILKTRGII